MNGIYPDDYEKSIDYDSFKKAIEHLAPMRLNLDEIRDFRDAVVKGKKSIIKAAHYCPEELNRIAMVMDCSDMILCQIDAIEKAMTEKRPWKDDDDGEITNKP